MPDILERLKERVEEPRRLLEGIGVSQAK
jgi:hypothetical protein